MTNQNIPQTLLFDRSAAQGRLELIDRDRFDLLHRMSTNDLQNMQRGEGRPTVFTTALARIIDRVIVYNLGETALMLTNQPESVRGWLQRHIFFQDKVKIRDLSRDKGQLELHGPSAAQIADSIVPGASRLALHHCLESPEIFVARTFPMAQEGFVFVAPMLDIDTLKQTILAQTGVNLGEDAQYEQLRIAAGLPGPGHELTEDYIPLEANLWDSVSFTKGCYIGQEIIARMESRNRLAKTLVSLNLSAGVPLGASLTNGDRVVGRVTSMAQKADGVIIGLGFVKPESAEPGTLLKIEGETKASAEVALPLLQTHR